MNSPVAAKPAKLRDDTWGARTSAPVEVGDTIRITTQAGKTWEAKVTRVVWSDGSAALVATQSLESKPAPARRPSFRPRGRRTGCSCGSIEDQPRSSDCASCRHDY